MSLDWLRVGTGKQVKGRKEGDEKRSALVARRLPWMSVGLCQARVIGLGDAAQAEPDASATR